jgi:phosphoribosylanthranilate isomerase
LSIRTKICGITRIEDLAASVNAGADAIGFVVGVPSSERNISLGKAEKLVSKVPVFVSSVLVMVPNNIEDLIQAYEMVKPDILQIHGEKVSDIGKIREVIPEAALIKGIKIKPKETPNVDGDFINFDAVLVDTFSSSKHGGTGKSHNWIISKKIRRKITPLRLILAGGLTPSNVREAILTVRPYAVDVSTGVESKPGIKDHNKVRLFLEQVKGVIL